MIDNRDNAIWTVYVHICKVDGKTYVGMTTNPTKRFAGGNGYYDQPFGKAIAKYGWDNFDHIIFASGLTKEEARNMEKSLISCLKSNNNRYGYNVRNGGDVKNLEVCQFDYFGNFICKYDSIATAALSFGKTHTTNINYNCRGKSFCAYGYVWRYANECNNLDKIKNEIANDTYYHRFYPVYQFDLKCNYLGSFSTVCEASKATGCDTTRIVKCCEGKQLKTNGFRWAYQKDVPDVNMYQVRRKHGNRNAMRAVVQMDLTGNYIAEYESSVEASRVTGFNSSNIYQCCCHEKKSHAKFQWVFKSEYNEASSNVYTKKNHNEKAVCRYDLKGNLIKKYPSISHASRDCGISIKQIATACSKHHLTPLNSLWNYADTSNNIIRREKKPESKSRKAVKQFDLNGNYIKTFPSITIATLKVGGKSEGNISSVCSGQKKSAYGYKWAYAENSD